MTLIGSRILNEIITDKKIYDPKLILENLELEIKKALRQEQTGNRDGMELSLFSVQNLKSGSYKITYSGARGHGYWMDKQNNELKKLTFDKRSISGFKSSNQFSPFSDNEIIVSQGDIFYLFSDGILHQPSVHGKCFGSSRFEKIVQEMYNSSMGQQKIILEQAIEDFSQNEHQRDDITIWGIKFR